MPSMQPVSVSCPVDADAARSCVSDGSPGRYMSIDSGPNADKAPRITISRGRGPVPARETVEMRRFLEPASIAMAADGIPLLGCAAVARLGRSDLDTFGLCLGGNVFGWTADEPQSFEVLDAYAAAGGNFIDSSDSYSAFAPGNQGGESETVLGNWFASRGNRADIVLATKVGRKPDRPGLSRANIRTAVAESLERLQSDYIDLYYAHADDPDTPLEDTLRAFDELVNEGTVKYIAASNYSAPRLAQALEISDREGLARYV